MNGRAAALVLAAALAGGEHTARGFMRPDRPLSPRLEGTWRSEGERGAWTVEIAAAGEAYSFVATSQRSGQRERGVGLVRGGHFFVAFPPPWGGITVYRFAPNGSARGEWTEQPRGIDEPQMLLLGDVELDPPLGGAAALVGEHPWRSRAGGAFGPLVAARFPVAIAATQAGLHFQWAPIMEGVGVQRGAWVGAVWGSANRPMSLVDYDLSLSTKMPRGVRVTLGEPGAIHDRLVRVP